MQLIVICLFVCVGILCVGGRQKQTRVWCDRGMFLALLVDVLNCVGVLFILVIELQFCFFQAFLTSIVCVLLVRGLVFILASHKFVPWCTWLALVLCASWKLHCRRVMGGARCPTILIR